jgi:hypothetical protein
MKKELGTVALCAMLLLVMYVIGEGIIDTVKAIVGSIS